MSGGVPDDAEEGHAVDKRMPNDVQWCTPVSGRRHRKSERQDNDLARVAIADACGHVDVCLCAKRGFVLLLRRA